MPPEICLLILGLLGAVQGLITGDEGPPGFSPLKTPVYFPIFPEDFKDFGLRLGGDVASQGRGKSLDMPTTTPKSTTTTDRLPINQDGLLSHVALESVTQPPGPSYLTDSYYYVADHTPPPGSEEESEEAHGLDLPDRESEKQDLQNLTPISGNSFGREPLSPLALIGVPAVSVTSDPTPPTPETTVAPAKPTRQPSRSSRPSRPPTPSKPSPSPSPDPQEVKVRPDITPAPTPPPTTAPRRVPQTSVATTTPPRVSYAPSRSTSRRPSSRPSSSRSSSRELSKSEGTTSRRPSKTRLVSRRPQFESSRLSGQTATTTTTTTTTTRRPTRTPSSAYRTPTPPTLPPATTTSSRRRGYRGRIRTSSPPPKRLNERERGKKQEAPVYRTSTKAYRAPSSLYHVRGATTTITAPSQPDFVQSDPNIYVPVEYDDEAIPGVAGIDYPAYSDVPDTKFMCDAQEHPGLYADTEAECQIFHICQEDGRHDSFLCPNGTVFNQQYFVCDWWYNFSCDHATRFYSLNAFIYEIPDAEKYSKK